MTSTTIDVFTEQDFFLIRTRLTENEIRFFEIIHSDSSFPGIKQSKVYGQIMIEGPFNKEIIDGFGDRIKIDVRQMSHPRANRKTSMSKYFLVAYSIIATLGIVYFWYRDYRFSGDKNYTFEWDTYGRVLTYKDNNTWEDVHIYTDNNYDLNFEESVTKSKNGKFITKYNDMDEDGIYESTIIKTSGFKTIARFYDDDNIGFDNRLEFILENNDTLRLQDENGNGFYEFVKPVGSDPNGL